MTLAPNTNPSTSSLVTATDTSLGATPALTVVDNTSSTGNDGYLQWTPVVGVCPSGTATESKLHQQLQIQSVTGLPTGWTGGTLPASLSSSATTLATASGPVAANAFTVNFNQAIDSNEVLVNGCTYQVTATYTLS